MNRKLAFFLLIVLIVKNGNCIAQIKMGITKKTETKKFAPVQRHSQEITPSGKEKLTLKITSTAECLLKIDGEDKGIIKVGDVKKVSLIKGDYKIYAVNTENKQDVFSEIYSVSETEIGFEKFYEIDMAIIIDTRIEIEKSIAEEKKAEELRIRVSVKESFENNKSIEVSLAATELKRQDALIEELEFYEKCKIKDDINYYKAYLATYPLGKYVEKCKTTIFKIEQEEFAIAREKGTLESYRSFLSNYPGSGFEYAANKEIDDIKLKKTKKSNLLEIASVYREDYRKYLIKIDSMEKIRRRCIVDAIFFGTAALFAGANTLGAYEENSVRGFQSVFLLLFGASSVQKILNTTKEITNYKNVAETNFNEYKKYIKQANDLGDRE